LQKFQKINVWLETFQFEKIFSFCIFMSVQRPVAVAWQRVAFIYFPPLRKDIQSKWRRTFLF
jgi:hypothetical protein